MTAPQYNVAFDPPSETLDPIEQGLHAFNLACLGEEIIRNYHRVAVVARDDHGQIVGGIDGELCWDWLYIRTMWVAEKHRGQGIGSRLLAEIQAAALSKGIERAHLETTDFQALSFYLKNGYVIFGELHGKPAGHTWYYLKKELGRMQTKEAWDSGPAEA